MIKRSFVVLALSGAAMAMPAMAQDIADEDAFNGLYVAASGGYDVQSNDLGSIIEFDRNGDGQFGDPVTTSTGANAFSTGFCNGRARDSVSDTGCENDRNRASYYGRVGYDRRIGNIVVGALAEFGKSEIRDYVSGYSTTPANYVLSRGLEWESSARLRAGYALGSGMFYATGGVGYANIKNRFTTTNTANAFSTSGNDKQLGFVVGGGVEKYLTRNISVGAEYTYHDYKDKDYEVLVTRGSALETNPFVLAPNTAGTTIRRSDDNFRWHSMRATVGFHF
jgi:outer membrane immunogenic protein